MQNNCTRIHMEIQPHSLWIKPNLKCLITQNVLRIQGYLSSYLITACLKSLFFSFTIYFYLFIFYYSFPPNMHVYLCMHIHACMHMHACMHTHTRGVLCIFNTKLSRLDFQVWWKVVSHQRYIETINIFRLLQDYTIANILKLSPNFSPYLKKTDYSNKPARSVGGCEWCAWQFNYLEGLDWGRFVPAQPQPASQENELKLTQHGAHW